MDLYWRSGDKDVVPLNPSPYRKYATEHTTVVYYSIYGWVIGRITGRNTENTIKILCVSCVPRTVRQSTSMWCEEGGKSVGCPERCRRTGRRRRRRRRCGGRPPWSKLNYASLSLNTRWTRNENREWVSCTRFPCRRDAVVRDDFIWTFPSRTDDGREIENPESLRPWQQGGYRLASVPGAFTALNNTRFNEPTAAAVAATKTRGSQRYFYYWVFSFIFYNGSGITRINMS